MLLNDDSSKRINLFFKADKFVAEADTQIGPQNFVALIIDNDHRRLGINVSVFHFSPPALYSARESTNLESSSDITALCRSL